MRGNELLDKMELIAHDYVESADVMPKRKNSAWLRYCAAAACLALVLFAGAELLLRDESDSDSDLPMLSISEDAAGMGYEGYLAYDISELVNSNPWRESSAISTLPVYENVLSFDSAFVASGADTDKMRTLILDIAESLGLDADALTVTDASTTPVISAEGMRIEVSQAMTASVFFEPAISLPEEYNFTYHASYSDKLAAAGYLKSEYREFIGFAEAQVNVYGGDRDIYGRQSYFVEFFDAGGSDAEQIINYNFNRVAFSCDDNGELFIARKYQPDLSKKLGDYPIISAAQAQELLLRGNYITSVPYALPGGEFIKKVELIYRTGEHEEYYMPYYRFYVELPGEERENGLKTFGAYYVPAVDSSYISNMPTWDGSFN